MWEALNGLLHIVLLILGTFDIYSCYKLVKCELDLWYHGCYYLY